MPIEEAKMRKSVF